MTPSRTSVSKTIAALLTVVGIVAYAVPADAVAAQPAGCSYREWRDQHKGIWTNNGSRDIPYVIIRSSFPVTIPGTTRKYNPDQIRNRIIAGARTWATLRTPCRIRFDGLPTRRFVYAGHRGSDAADWDDNVNTVDFRNPVPTDDGKAYLLDPNQCKFSDVALGCEHTRSQNSVSPVSVETDISFNKTLDWWTEVGPVGRSNAYDLWSLAAHEFGHAYDIAHPIIRSDDNPTAVEQQVMWNELDEGQTRRSLMGGDVTALCTQYTC